MARHVVHRVTDDLDGSPDAATIHFSLDDQPYEIDLGPRNEARLRDAIAVYIAHATPLATKAGSRGDGVATRTRDLADRERAQHARRWALENGVQLPTRGRVAQAVLDAVAGEDVPALYEAVGLEYDAPAKPRRSARKSTRMEFKA